VEVDATEGCCLIQMTETVARERLCHLASVLLLSWQVEAGHHTRVLVKARSLWKSSQSTFDLTDAGLKLKVG
jgi:hypothetical protein